MTATTPTTDIVQQIGNFLNLNQKVKSDFTDEEIREEIFYLRTHYPEFFQFAHLPINNKYEWLTGAYSVLKTIDLIKQVEN